MVSRARGVDEEGKPEPTGSVSCEGPRIQGDALGFTQMQHLTYSMPHTRLSGYHPPTLKTSTSGCRDTLDPGEQRGPHRPTPAPTTIPLPSLCPTLGVVLSRSSTTPPAFMLSSVSI